MLLSQHNANKMTCFCRLSSNGSLDGSSVTVCKPNLAEEISSCTLFQIFLFACPLLVANLLDYPVDWSSFTVYRIGMVLIND